MKRRPLVVVSNDAFNRHSNLTMTVPVTSAGGYPLHVDVGVIPSDDGDVPIRGFAEAEQLKALDLEARRGVIAGRLPPEKAEAVLSMVLGCLVGPDMTVISGW